MYQMLTKPFDSMWFSFKAGIDAEAAEQITGEWEVQREGNSSNRIAISAYHMVRTVL